MNKSNIINFPAQQEAPKAPIRETFGLINGRTGQLYHDILAFSLYIMDFTYYHLHVETLERDGIVYKLHMDSKLKRALKALEEGGYKRVIISYQQRTTGAIALARIYHNSKRDKNITRS